MKKIYVVIRSTGEYSDREEYPVIALLDEEKAKERVLNATKRAVEIYAEYENEIFNDELPEGLNEFDKNMTVDSYTKFPKHDYFYYTVDLEG